MADCVVVAGGTGLVGSALVRRLLHGGRRVRVLSRDPSAGPGRELAEAGAEVEQWNGYDAPPDLGGAAAVVNLCGAGIAERRWTAARRAQLRRSRLEPTAALAAAVVRDRVPLLISASGLGIYGAAAAPCDEQTPPGDGFLATLARDWEAASTSVAEAGLRRVVLRLGPVLAPNGGMLDELLGKPLAVLGSGRQIVPWIHIDDVVAIIAHARQETDLHGALNCAAPCSTSMAELVATIAQRSGRWRIPGRVPSWVLRLLLGEMADMLVIGPPIDCTRLTRSGFTWRYPDPDAALGACLGDRR